MLGINETFVNIPSRARFMASLLLIRGEETRAKRQKSGCLWKQREKGVRVDVRVMVRG